MSSVNPFGEDLEVEAEEVVQAKGDGLAFRLIDVREQEELVVEKVEGAEWIPLSEWGERWEAALPESDARLVFF